MGLQRLCNPYLVGGLLCVLPLQPATLEARQLSSVVSVTAIPCGQRDARDLSLSLSLAGASNAMPEPRTLLLRPTKVGAQEIYRGSIRVPSGYFVLGGGTRECFMPETLYFGIVSGATRSLTVGLTNRFVSLRDYRRPRLGLAVRVPFPGLQITVAPLGQSSSPDSSPWGMSGVTAADNTTYFDNLVAGMYLLKVASPPFTYCAPISLQTSDSLTVINLTSRSLAAAFTAFSRGLPLCGSR